MAAGRELDILGMPVEALAAYWLSLKKLLDSKRDRTLLATERENTDERYIRHLLDLAASGLDAGLTRRLAEAKAAALLDEIRRRFRMMRAGLCAIAKNENPRLTLVRLQALSFGSPLSERRAFELAHGLLEATAEPAADLPTLLRVDHRQKDDRLTVKLLFYAMAARRNGRQALHEYLPHLAPGPFPAALSLVADGLDADFVEGRILEACGAILLEARRKMRMSAELCLALRTNLSYEDLFRIARSFMA